MLTISYILGHIHLQRFMFNNQMLYERNWVKTGLSMPILNTLDKHQNSNFAETNPEMYSTLLKLAKKQKI